jgi:ammonium transporter Rh
MIIILLSMLICNNNYTYIYILYFYQAFFKQWWDNDWHLIEVDIHTCMEGMFLVASILISYGAIIGKVSPLQLVVMTLIEAVFYSLNKVILLLGVVNLVDGECTMCVSVFYK